MPYQIKGLTKTQEVATIIINASSEEEAILEAKRKGFLILSIIQNGAGASTFLNSKSAFPLLLFSYELLSLLKAGLSLVDSIETLREKEHKPHVKAVLNQIMQSLYEGLPLSQALERQQAVFPPLYIALISSSEKTGDLSESLQRFVDYQVQADLVRKKIISSSIYPAILLMVGGMVIMFLMLYVVPKFSVIYENKGNSLPWLSLALLTWGRLLHQHALIVFIGSIGVTFSAIFLGTRKKVRQYFVNYLWKIPQIGERMRIYQLSRFYRTLGMLLRGGIPIITAIGMVMDLLQPHLQTLLRLAEQEIRQGQAISVAMENHQLTTPVAVRMMRVGEHSGQMGEMMERIGDFYDDEITRWLDWFMRIFEPLLMTFIGVVVGIIVVVMYMPIFELAGSIQ